MSRRKISESQQKSNLIIFDGQVIVLLSFLVRDLHEEPADKSLPDVKVERPLVLRRDKVQVETLHDTLKLCANVFGLRECSPGEIIIPRPILVVDVYLVKKKIGSNFLNLSR